MVLGIYAIAAEVFVTVESRLSQAAGVLAVNASHWVPICADAAALANGVIHRTLLGKSYTPAQLANDPSIPPLAKEIAVYFAMLSGANASGYELESIKIKGELALKQLEDFPAYNDIQIVAPEGPAQVSVGTINQYTEVKHRWA